MSHMSPASQWVVVTQTAKSRLVSRPFAMPAAANAEMLDRTARGEKRTMFIMDADLAQALPNRRQEKKLEQNPRRSKVKDALAAEALRYPKFKDFAERYWHDCARGIYWYGTNDPTFRFGQYERRQAAKKKFILHCSPEEATKDGEKYAVEMNVNGLRMSVMNIKRTEAGAEVRVTRGLDAIRIMRIMPRDKAMRAYRYALGLLPSSKTELYKFWKTAWQKQKAKEEKEAKAAQRKAEREARRTARLEKKDKKQAKKRTKKRTIKKVSKRSKAKANPVPVRPCLIPSNVNVPGED